MKTAHPGCGGHAGSKGYNSGGHYCGGWAGNCGDGGVGGSSWYGFCVLNFLSILSNFLFPEKLTQKIAEQLRKISIFEWWKFTVIQKSHLALGKIAVLFNFIIQEFKFWKITQLFLCVSFSGQRKFERIERKFKPQKPDLNHIGPPLPNHGTKTMLRYLRVRLLIPKFSRTICHIFLPIHHHTRFEIEVIESFYVWLKCLFIRKSPYI